MGTRHVAAFFDIDHTVLEVNSGTKWVAYQWNSGRMGVFELMRALWWTGQYRFGWLDFSAMATRVIAQYEGQEVAPIEREVSEWFQRDVAWAICTEARERIEEHRDQGHVVALLTSATRFLSRPVADALSLQHILCTEVEEADGRFTGKFVPPACYGPGKVERAEVFAAAHDVDLDASYFYSDSVSDLPMLQRVGEPRVVNPDPRLRRKAAELGWSVERWSAPKPEAGRGKEVAR
ncbi:MAG: HAD family hydrolase [Myxococcota bacterium]